MNEGKVTVSDFAKIRIRVGKVVTAENVEKSKKLIRLSVDFGDSLEEVRTIFTGVRGYGYTPEDFAGKQFLFVTNLEPKKIMDEESQGMILAVDPPPHEASDGPGGPVFISAEGLPLGANVR